LKTFKYTIANTLPDQQMVKFTKNVLKRFRDQINNAFPLMPVTIGSGEKEREIGHIENARISTGDLICDVSVNPETVDKQWEYFFAVRGNMAPFEQQGNIKVVTKADIVSVSMTRAPASLTSKPITFFEYIKEDQDYFIKHYEELDELAVKRIKKSGEQTYVYYPVSVTPDELIDDARKRGLVIDHDDGTGETVKPFNIDSFDGTLEQFKEHINGLWKTQIEHMEAMVNPSRKPTKAQF